MTRHTKHLRYINLIAAGYDLVRRLSGARTQSGTVKAEGTRQWAGTLVNPPSLRGDVSHAPSVRYTPAFVLQVSENHGKTSVTVAEKCLTAYRAELHSRLRCHTSCSEGNPAFPVSGQLSS